MTGSVEDKSVHVLNCLIVNVTLTFFSGFFFSSIQIQEGEGAIIHPISILTAIIIIIMFKRRPCFEVFTIFVTYGTVYFICCLESSAGWPFFFITLFGA